MSPTASRIDVSDDGRPAGAGAPIEAQAAEHRPGPGHGIIGMRERVLVYGGQFLAGPIPGGGFRVEAVLPLAAAPA